MDQVCRRICRICLISNSDDSLLFTNQCLRVLTVFDCYKILTQSDHNQEEYHMSSMCLECVKKMVSFIEFRCLAIKNNDYFTKLKNGLICLDPLNEEAYDDKNLVLNDFTGYQPSLSSVKEEFLEDEAKLLTLEIKEEVKFMEKNSKLKQQARKYTETFSCLEFDCNKVFKNKVRLKNHKNLTHKTIANVSMKHSTEKKLKKTLCTFCGKYLRSEHFKDHILRMHFDGKASKYLCDYCGKGYLHKCGLRDHMFRHINHRTFKCDECDFWTVSQSYVNAHKKLKHVEIVYQNCSYPECKYTCRLIAQLKNHISIFHLGLLPYVCVDCGKSFGSSSSLTEHKATHSDEKNFECVICQKRFKTKVQRNTHSKQSHQEAKFHCEICSKPFHSHKILQIHINQIHDKIRSFECNLCDKNYTTRRYLLDHVKEIHFKAKISCEVCGTKLARMANYKMHVKAKHKDLGEERITALKLRMKKLKPDYEKMEYYYAN